MSRGLAAGIFAAGLAAQAAVARAAVTVGQPVPEFSVSTVEGQRVDLSDLRGKRVLVFMWASW